MRQKTWREGDAIMINTEEGERMVTLHHANAEGDAWMTTNYSGDLEAVNVSDFIRKATKKDETKEEEADACNRLRKMLPPGSTVWAVLRKDSASGMTRHITFIFPYTDESTGELRMFDATWLIGKALDYRRDQDTGGLVVQGCGMDMGFSVVYDLSRVLYREGFGCTGQNCRSNDHSNGDRNRTPHSEENPHMHTDPGYALRCEWL